MIIKKGVPATGGYAVGTAYVVESTSYKIVKHSTGKDVKVEKHKFMHALDKVIDELSRTKRLLVKRRMPSTVVQIVESHMALVLDKALTNEIEETIESNRYTAEYAVASVLRKKIKALEQIGRDEFAERIGESLAYAKNMLLGFMSRGLKLAMPKEGKWIIVAENLSPTETIAMDKKHVDAICLDRGGRTSHTAIVAASLGIPCVVALKDLRYEVTAGDTLIVDGHEGAVIINPDTQTIQSYLQKRKASVESARPTEKELSAPACTRDGKRIVLLGNIEFPEEIEFALKFGAEGIGLYRSEFMFQMDHVPTEEEHFRHYRKAVQLLGDRELVIRTADLGADKVSLSKHAEANPLMGLRGIRFSLENMDIFRPQLRALIRTSMIGNVKILLPMVSSVGEVNKVRSIINSVYKELFGAKTAIFERVKLGVMLETPAACFVIPELKNCVDFFSVGTNDLIAYLFAADRGNEMISQFYKPYHISVLKILCEIATSLKKCGAEFSICGELASDPLYTIILLGLGFEKLSMVPHKIPEIKAIINSLTLSECRAITSRLMKSKGSEDLDAHLRSALNKATGRG